MRTRLSVGLVAALLLGSAGQVRADFIGTTLGSAANYAILNISSANATVALNGPGTTTGNVGLINGNLALDGSAGPSIVGNVFLGANATNTHSQLVQGAIFTNQDTTLNMAATAARNASTTFGALAPTPEHGSTFTSGGTITAANPGGINVLSISGINLNGTNVTLNGPAGTQFVINVSGGMTLTGSKILLSGGVIPYDVVFNFTGNPELSTSGGGNASQVNGILLAPNSGTSIDFSPGLVNGEVISGGTHNQFVSGAEVLPAPSSLILMGLGGLAFVGLVVRSRRLAVTS